MRRVSTIIVLALCTSLFASTSSAQQASTTATTTSTSVPNLIRYSGTLKDAQGAALGSTTPIGVMFAIYNQEDGGAAVWQETQNVTPEANGQYSVLLGSTTAAGLPGDLFSQQEQRWLGVQVQGQEEQARVLLVSVPYALKAHEADTLGGMPASAIIKAATLGAAGIASANGTSVNALSNAGTPPGARGKDGKLPPGGCLEVPGWITYWNINGALCQSSLFQVLGGVFSGYVGIGTTKPSTQLDVTGAIDVAPTTIMNSSTGNYQILENAVLGIGYPAKYVILANENTYVGPFAGGQGGSNLSDTGIVNTFVGYNAFFHNQGGSQNTGLGVGAGFRNDVGNNNTYLGFDSGWTNAGNINNNTFTGWESGFANSGSNNVFSGYQAGSANTASNNVFVGYQSGLGNVGGNFNTFVGSDTGVSNNTGGANTYVGRYAGYSNASGVSNTMLGANAGFSNTGGYNTFVGSSAGQMHATGDGNTMVGNSAGLHGTTGASNSFFGNGAGDNNTGDNNTFAGFNAGKANTANGNSFYGYNSGPVNNTGIQNVFMGWQTGLVNTSGFSNVFMGYQAGQANVDQSYNTFVGANAGYSSDAGGNTLIGYSAGSNTSGNNGYGITAVGYDAGRANTTGTLNAYFGVNAGFNGVGSPPATGSQNTYLGNGAGSSANLGAGSNNIFVGFAAGNAENAVNNNIEIGNSGPAPTGSNTIVIGSTQTAAYLAGITAGPPPGLNSVLVDNTGRLWQAPSSGGGGNVVGPNPPCAANYLTIWEGGLNVGCSIVWQNPTSPFFVGIGTNNPSTALDVNGDINALLDKSSYQIGESTVLSAFGDRNTFVGFSATPPNCVYGIGTCAQNTFTGNLAGNANTTGTLNSFYGSAAGPSNTGGTGNTCIGQEACRDLQNGNNDTYVGVGAGYLSNVNGSSNTYVGAEAGSGNTNGNSNIYLKNGGTSESNTIRIGTQGTGDGQQNATYIAGIFPSLPGGAALFVCIDNTGKLGAQAAPCGGSSSRFKEQIASMGDSSSRLFQLRPVTFLYKPDYDKGTRTPQYGLIAEEVAKVYPEMVVYDKDGQPYTVKYQMLAPMLLNELQKEHTVVMAQQDELQTQLQQIEAQRLEIDGLKRQLQQQNASLQERLSKLESYVATQMKTASDNPPLTTTGTNGGGQ